MSFLAALLIFATANDFFPKATSTSASTRKIHDVTDTHISTRLLHASKSFQMDVQTDSDFNSSVLDVEHQPSVLEWHRSPHAMEPPFEYLVRTELGISWTRARARCRSLAVVLDAASHSGSGGLSGAVGSELLELRTKEQAHWAKKLLADESRAGGTLHRVGGCLALNAHRHLYSRVPTTSTTQHQVNHENYSLYEEHFVQRIVHAYRRVQNCTLLYRFSVLVDYS